MTQVADSSTRDVARADGAGILCSRSWIWLHISAGEEASFESGNRGSSQRQWRIQGGGAGGLGPPPPRNA